MAALVPGKPDMTTGVFLNVLGVPQRQYDPAFDSYLLLKPGGTENHTLTLVLKVYLKQAPTYGMKKFVHLDWDKNAFVITPWKPSEWAQFRKQFQKQCMLWNNNFWLIPPKNFSKLDVKVGRRVVRPNIYCHLYVQLTGSPAGAHRAIEVANLDTGNSCRLPGATMSWVWERSSTRPTPSRGWIASPCIPQRKPATGRFR